LSEPEFLEIVREAAADAGRQARLVERRGAARDHPALLSLPESLYLKCFILEAN
jgi:23S rRNA (cytosine1962-C5)-methyltransferase